MANMRFTDKNGTSIYDFIRNPRFPLDILYDERKTVSRINIAGNRRKFVQAVKQVITLNFPFIDIIQHDALKIFKDLNDEFRWYLDPVASPTTYLRVTMQNEWRKRQFAPTLFSLIMVIEEI